MIAREPTGMDEDSLCSVCGDNTIVLVISGETKCNYCGNEVYLCSCCCAIMKRQMNDINDGLNKKVNPVFDHTWEGEYNADERSDSSTP